MDTPHDVALRSARDRIIDLLGVGDTYPLTDLDVIADQLKVPFGAVAKIPIENAQAGVAYELCDPKGEGLGDAFKAEGADARLVIDTPPVSEDVTYRIRATKKSSEQAPRFLDEGAPVKVGLDTALQIRILPESTPLLDPDLASPRPSDARIVPYGASVEVEIQKSQEGVQYSLMIDEKDVKDVWVLGDLHDVRLHAGPLGEDAVIRVRATKNFPGQKKDPESSLLDAKLYVKVMANPAAAVSVDSSPVVDYGEGATLKIANTQANAQYEPYVRTIPDADFVHGPAAGVEVVSVAVPGKPDAQVRKPPQSGAWDAKGYASAGYVSAGEAVPGTGGELKFALKDLKEDCMIIVRAQKQHRPDLGDPSRTIPSAIRLDQAAVVLVRPDPARALTLRVPVSGAQTGDSMQMSGGQPGVFYYFRPEPAGEEFKQSAYFHKRDDADNNENKGVGQIAVEVDFAIAADPDAARPADVAKAAPRAPLLGITPVAAGASLSIRAMKAQTAVEKKMSRDAQIAAVPAIRAEPPLIDAGSAAKILIPSSDPKDQYQLMLNGAPVGAPLAGNKADLEIVTDPLSADANFVVVVTRPADEGMRVERVVSVPVTVRPKAQP